MMTSWEKRQANLHFTDCYFERCSPAKATTMQFKVRWMLFLNYIYAMITDYILHLKVLRRLWFREIFQGEANNDIIAGL